MLKIGITGQPGFIGSYLYNTLGLQTAKFHRIPFEDSFFQNCDVLDEFVGQCDVIVHLAAMNRHHDPEIIYETNIRLVNQLIESMERTGKQPHVIFSSSIQEEQDNLYGKSKKVGRKLFETWAERNNGLFTGLLIPNVFGPFGVPFFNSVTATFCYQLNHNETPTIENDSVVKLIYVGEVVAEMIRHMEEGKEAFAPQQVTKTVVLPHSNALKVSELLAKLVEYKKAYYTNGTIPDLTSSFDRNLFTTFLCYLDHQRFYPAAFKKNVDNRGTFIETIKTLSGGQTSFSLTIPGITRGNHFHTRKVERFAVIKGKAKIELRRINTREVLTFELDGDNPAFVDMPIWHTHNITNIGTDELYTIFWINEFFNPADPDTYFEIV